ncbi:MAG: hypothetical protein HDT47_10195 [Ruminococcaceae bacterium]|nr:hypothetical protein [Oscillospiraceae bacterium]
MKDFGKKLISALMALVMTASMLVYAEELSPIENGKENSQVECLKEPDIVANKPYPPAGSCSHSSCEEVLSDFKHVYSFTHTFTNKNGEKESCYVQQFRFTFTYVCNSCGESIGTRSGQADYHSNSNCPH